MWWICVSCRVSWYLGSSSAGLFFFKRKPAYERRISCLSSDVCSSDLRGTALRFLPDERGEPVRKLRNHRSDRSFVAGQVNPPAVNGHREDHRKQQEIGSATCRERGGQ